MRTTEIICGHQHAQTLRTLPLLLKKTVCELARARLPVLRPCSNSKPPHPTEKSKHFCSPSVEKPLKLQQVCHYVSSNPLNYNSSHYVSSNPTITAFFSIRRKKKTWKLQHVFHHVSSNPSHYSVCKITNKLRHHVHKITENAAFSSNLQHLMQKHLIWLVQIDSLLASVWLEMVLRVEKAMTMHSTLS